MMLRELDYQTRVLKRFDEYLSELVKRKQRADKIEARNAIETDADLIQTVPDFAAEAWEALRKDGKLPKSRSGIPYSARRDGIGRTVPNAVLKVPTGGGKTFLAVATLSKLLGRYLGRHTGFVLWIVPNEAIYAQTKRQLVDRQHPYRQLLDVLSGNRTRLMEKTDPLDARDVGGGLCVMLLMLQSSNRENKDTLKLFQDRGDVQGFFPPEGDMEAHRLALEATPNLDAYGKAGEAGAFWPMVKDSLGNALRLIRPVVVMDEGHRAISELAFSTLYGFNPCFVLELTATPKDVAASGGKQPKAARPANVLVEVQGIELDREGMVKMPMNLDVRASTDWRSTLAASLERLEVLERAARKFQADSGRYIRPILLVQVERTGADQHDGAHVHARDAEEWLMKAGLDKAEIATKTADTNDLAAPENQDLLSQTNRVRVIVTKQALQEGWDCPFAYVLCALAASSNQSALTQLVGRILRQPQAEKTTVAALDECYVLTHRADTASVVAAIKKGLEDDGLGDLVKKVRIEGDGSTGKTPTKRRIPRRDTFAKTEIYLPRVLRVEGKTVRALDYEEDVLFHLEWRDFDVSDLVRKIPDNAHVAERQMRRIHLIASDTARADAEVAGDAGESLQFDAVYAVRMISDIVLNPWVGRELVDNVLAGLRVRGFDADKLGACAGLIVQTMREWLDARRVEMAEARFRDEVTAGRIQFRLRADEHDWRMPVHTESFEPEGAAQLVRADGKALEKSLFSPIYRDDFSSSDERDIAVYLDADKTLDWWHRNVARSHYSVQGWRREKIYPDFIFALTTETKKRKRLVVLEMKGEHLSGNPDTVYKQAVLQLMSQSFARGDGKRVGELELVSDSSAMSVACDLVLMPEWRTRLPSEFLTG